MLCYQLAASFSALLLLGQGQAFSFSSTQSQRGQQQKLDNQRAALRLHTATGPFETGGSGDGNVALLDLPTAQNKKAKMKKDCEEFSDDAIEKYKLKLYDDSENTRGYVARRLVQVVGMSEGDAFGVMMNAHKYGQSTVGVFFRDSAETFHSGLLESGLTSRIFPVDE